MHLRPRRLAIFFAASSIAAATAIFACSTDNGTTTLPAPDANRPDTGSNPDEDAPVDPGVDACADAFVPRTSTGPRCLGVLDAGGDGGSGGKNCLGKLQICCSDGTNMQGGFEPSDCLDAAVVGNGFQEGLCTPTFTGDGGQEWHCTEQAHCPGTGAVCCMRGTAAGNPVPAPNNDWPGCDRTKFQSPRFNGGTRCRNAMCNAGEIQLCSSDSECTAGSCIFLSASGRNIGYCRVQ
jgi:hypothetical protein